MKYNVKVKPGAKQEKIEVDGSSLIAWIKEQPERGKANQGLIDILKKYFKIPKSRIEIISGFKSKNKVVRIEK